MSSKSSLTIVDIAQLAGVSKSTVSRALNNSPLIGEETKERIQAIAKEKRFQINNPARNLSLKQSRALAFVTPACYHAGKGYTLQDLFLLEIMGAISSSLLLYDYDMLMACIDPYDPCWPCQYLDTGKVDGFILITSNRKTNLVKSLVDIQAPFIVWGAAAPNAPYCSVIGDNLTGGRLATEHLIRTGRKRIAFMGGPVGEIEVDKRYEGYANSLKDAGIEIDPKIVTLGEYGIVSSEERTRKLLNVTPNIDAIFANSDIMALAAINVLQESGRKVPDDVAVVGYDDLSIAANNYPSITTIRQNIPLVGKLLAENMIQFLQTGIVTHVTVPSELIIRKST